MPEKIGKPLVKSEKEKEVDKKLIEEIKEDPANPGAEFDPLEAQADRLPSGIKGSDGDKEHVLPVDGAHSAGANESADLEEEFDEIDDPNKLTAD